MSRIPYEIISVEALRLYDKAAMCPDWETHYYIDMYHALLEGSGWTDKELDEETLRRVDLCWEQLCADNVIPIANARNKKKKFK